MNVGGTQHAAELGAPLVYFSTDYVFDGAKRDAVRRVGRAESARRLRPQRSSTARPPRATQAWIVRSSWLFGPTGHNFVRTMLRLGARARRGRGRRRPARLPDLHRPPRRGGRRASSSCRSASTTWPPTATAPGPSSPRRSSRRPGSTAACAAITTAEFGAKAPRPAYSVLRSEKGAPELPHWREGLRDCLAR